MTIFEKDVAIDIGTASTLLFEQGKGIVLREPTLVALDKYSGKMEKVGRDAYKLVGRTPANIVSLSPVSNGVICDYEVTAQMLTEFMSRITSFSLFKPCVVVCVPSSITGVEERAVIDACIEAGARKVYLLESAIATALGAGVDISQADGHMIIDIGAGTTEIAVVSGGGVVECESIKVAGNAFDEAIVRYVRNKYGLKLDVSTAEEIKRSIGCVLTKPDATTEKARGSNKVNGMPLEVDLTSSDLIEAFVDPMNRILEAIHTVMERTPPSLVSDVDRNGIILSGGGSLIYGIDKLIERSTGIRTMLVDDALSCAAYGAGKLLGRLDEMQEGMMNYYRKRQLRN